MTDQEVVAWLEDRLRGGERVEMDYGPFGTTRRFWVCLPISGARGQGSSLAEAVEDIIDTESVRSMLAEDQES